MRHLEQFLANDGHLAELSRRAHESMPKPREVDLGGGATGRRQLEFRAGARTTAGPWCRSLVPFP